MTLAIETPRKSRVDTWLSDIGVGQILLAVALLLYPAIAFAQNVESDPSDEGAEKPPADKVAVDSVVDDAAIQRRLERILAASDWFSSSKVQVDEGIVVLSGETDEAEHREWAADISRRTEDVVAVVNNITISDTVDVSQSMSVVTNSLDTLWKSFLKRLPLILAGIVVVILTWIVARIAASIVRSTARRSRLRGGLQDLARQLTTCAVWLTGLMITAVILFPGMTPAKLLTVLGLGSVAIGFAFKDIFENFFAGVLILWRFPLEKGDFIECGDVFGKVEDITVRMTSIRQVDGQLVVLPNAMLFKEAVYVSTSRKSRRITIICGIGYGEEVAAARDVIRKAVEQCNSVDRQEEIEIFAHEFGDSSVNFEVTWWCGSTPLEERQSRDEVVEAVKRGLDEAGIEIPFPYRTLTFSQPLSIENREAGDDVPAEPAPA